MTSQTAHTLPDQTPPNERSRRAPLSVLCEVRQGTRPWQLVRLEDLSQAGFRLRGLNHVSMGKALNIRIPGMQLLTAQLRWQEGATIGCEFNTPLHIAVFDHLVAQANSARNTLGR